MKDDYPPRSTDTLPPDCTIAHPDTLPELVHYQGPADAVFIDFSKERPATVRRDTAIDSALEDMKHSGSCVLLVVDEGLRVTGQITADDIMGDKPVRLAESTEMNRNQMTVEMLMTSRERIQVLGMDHLKDAQVGHIVATLNALESRHVLVIDDGVIRGLFSSSEIGRRLGYKRILDEETPAHSLAELVHNLPPASDKR